MATVASPSGQSQEAAFLRENWHPENLGRYEGQWVAVSGFEIVGSSESLETLLDETAGREPLFAYVTFMPLQ